MSVQIYVSKRVISLLCAIKLAAVLPIVTRRGFKLELNLRCWVPWLFDLRERKGIENDLSAFKSISLLLLLSLSFSGFDREPPSSGAQRPLELAYSC